MSDHYKPGSRSIRIDKTAKHIKIFQGSSILADTIRPITLVEKNETPAYYFPPENVDMNFLRKNSHIEICELKGKAVFYDLEYTGNVIENAAWSYPDPKMSFKDIEDYIAFNPAKTDAFYINGELISDDS